MKKYSSAKLNLNVRPLIHWLMDGPTETVQMKSLLNIKLFLTAQFTSISSSSP